MAFFSFFVYGPDGRSQDCDPRLFHSITACKQTGYSLLYCWSLLNCCVCCVCVCLCVCGRECSPHIYSTHFQPLNQNSRQLSAQLFNILLFVSVCVSCTRFTVCLLMSLSWDVHTALITDCVVVCVGFSPSFTQIKLIQSFQNNLLLNRT